MSISSSPATGHRLPRIVLGLSGSVATVKWASLVTDLCAFADVIVVPTKSSLHFFGDVSEAYDGTSYASASDLLKASLSPSSEGASSSASLGKVVGSLRILKDEDEWSSYKSVHQDRVLHIELRKWADLLLIAPLSANTLAKVSNGMCDNLLTCIARAWPLKNSAPPPRRPLEMSPVTLHGNSSSGGMDASTSAFVAAAPAVEVHIKPFIVAPAMNDAMWLHPITATQIAQLASWGIGILQPIEKKLACGDVAIGAMASIKDIVSKVREALPSSFAIAEATESAVRKGDN